MKLIITKAECKQLSNTRVTSGKGVKKTVNAQLYKMPFYNADQLIDEVLFSRILFNEQMVLRSIKENKVFILENCSLYNMHKAVPHVHH